MTAGTGPIVIASNRGPVAFVRTEDGSVVQRRGVGGLVTAVGGAVRGRNATWVAAAITAEDRARAGAGKGAFDVDLRPGATDPSSVHVRLALLDQARYDLYYNELSNRVLWFLHHDLWETPRLPTFGHGDADAWEAYREVNARFAELLAEHGDDGGAALPQDYHLSLVPAELRARRPDMPIALFWHIPFSAPDTYRVLPDEWGSALLEGMLAADVIGFQTDRWAGNFMACCREVLGARTRGRTVTVGERSTRIGVFPIGVDAGQLLEEAARPEVARAAASIEQLVGDRTMILRVDRTELSKNILRGFLAYETVLERRPDLHERVIHVAMLTPSRRGVPEYQEYMQACKARAARINERFGTASWQPLVLEIEDDFARTLAGYQRYDVLVVNPVFDGMNLVAREGPLLNEHDGVLVLSRNAGAAAELGPGSLIVNPFDPVGTARALEQAVDMAAGERRELAGRLKPLARGTPPERWLRAQLKELSRPRAS